MERVARIIGGLAFVLALSCKDPETAAQQQRLRTTLEQMDRGRLALADGDYEKAIAAFKAAASASPDDPSIYLALADAYKRAGNDGAAVLAVKQAEGLLPPDDPTVKRQQAELYRRMGQTGPAIKVMSALRDQNQLTDEEVLILARMLARAGDLENAYKTLDRVLVRRPDDQDAKVVEAEILLIEGEELRAAKLMDRLLEENPNNTAARVLRARYFFNSGYPEMAEQDLSQLSGEAATQPEVVGLKSRILNQLKRYDEAVKALEPLIEKNPRDAELYAFLAETKLNLGLITESELLVDQALALKPRYARALYVRGRALEAKGELRQAAENYQYALKSDPSFGPALSRIWRIWQHRGEKGEAMSALERLLFMNEASLEERVALAEMYAESGMQLERGKRIIDEAIRREPNNPRYKQIRASLLRASASMKKSSPSIQIIRGGR